MNQPRGPWYLFTGLVMGLAMGLVYAWLLEPAQFTDASPRALEPTEQAVYRSMIALGYQANKDFGRAAARLALLGDENPALALRNQAEMQLSAGGQAQDAQALVDLSMALQSMPATQTAQAATLAVSTPTPPAAFTPGTPEAAGTEGAQAETRAPATPQATFTPRPTAASSGWEDAPYVLLEQEALCDDDGAPRIEIEVRDAQGQPRGGVPVNITWASGSNTFYTGLHPQISSGYADFEMAENEVYSLRVGRAGEAVNDLKSEVCESGGAGGWRLVFGLR
ncbi:hypothetical protein ADN00_17840 [Ornatilinea apprima]|uniref:Uncharacterized protein n=1 Tax=Ornatilinea apprima TaxID=1134406 RepID=A0A0P6WXA1_9CHLR|nr:hypothetical protein [Ornatilinea apprima]KPL70897.1 hypothetical protein ADN00_17840 [Ornatilinea apprima]